MGNAKSVAKPFTLVLRLAAHRLQNFWGLSQAWPKRLKDHEWLPLRDSLEPSPAAKERAFSVCSVLLTMLHD